MMNMLQSPFHDVTSDDPPAPSSDEGGSDPADNIDTHAGGMHAR